MDTIEPFTFLVTGATGLTGSEVVRRISSRGQRVRALVRASSTSPRRAAIANLPGVEIIAGDYLDHPSLGRACKGVDFVIATASLGAPHGGYSYENVDVQGNAALFAAAEAAGVQHLCFISTIRATEFTSVPMLAAKAKAEAALERSGLDYTILRVSDIIKPDALLAEAADALAGRPLRVLGDGSALSSPMFSFDLAELCVRSHAISSVQRRCVDVGGPEILSGIERAEAIAQAVGMEDDPPLEYCPPPTNAQIVAVADPAQRSQMLWQAIAAVNDFAAEMDEVKLMFSVRLTSIGDYIAQHMAEVRAILEREKEEVANGN
jgi:uncharacterized protein YbjT (DUF2867 family)